MFQYICIISWKKNQYACNTSIFNLRCAPCKLAGLALSWQKPSGSLVGGVGAWPDRRLSAEKCWTILPQDTPWIQSFRVDGGKPWNHDAARSISYDLNGFRGMERIETKQDPLKQNGIHLIWVKSMILQDPHYIFVSQGATSNSFQAILPGLGCRGWQGVELTYIPVFPTLIYPDMEGENFQWSVWRFLKYTMPHPW